MTGQESHRERTAAQLDQVDFLRAMYPLTEEISMDPQTEDLLSSLREWCNGGGSPQWTALPDVVSLLLTLPVSTDTDGPVRSISITIQVPLKGSSVYLEPSPPDDMRVRLRQPDWLTKAEVARLVAGMDESMDAFSTIEHIRVEASAYLEAQAHVSAEKTSNVVLQRTIRAWFHFPSISTREKRNDIVKYAPRYGLTGFLLAGKPGILCLEGGAQDIDDYMQFIKTESWGDIPSQHKKVSERYREDLIDDSARSFSGMEEITDKLERRGERSNRGDMKALEKWLDAKGMGDAFSKVLM